MSVNLLSHGFVWSLVCSGMWQLVCVREGEALPSKDFVCVCGHGISTLWFVHLPILLTNFWRILSGCNFFFTFIPLLTVLTEIKKKSIFLGF